MKQEWTDGPAPARILSAPEHSALLAAGLALAHALAWAPVLIFLIREVPRFKRIFADFGMKLPELTMVLLDVSDVGVALGWIGVMMVGAVLLSLDWLILFLLLWYHSILGWVWFGLLILGAVLAWQGCWYLVFMPLFELMEGLSK